MISEGFVANGATVYISSRDGKACETAVNELNGLGKGTAYSIPADFYREEDCKKLAEALAKRENGESDDGTFPFPSLGGIGISLLDD